MFTVLSSPKPGSGTSTTAALLALTAAVDRPTVLVDLTGDQACLLATAASDRISMITNRLEMIHAEDLPISEQVHLLGGLDPSACHIIVDAGAADHPIHQHLADATATWVLRPCYLALRRAIAAGSRPDQIILLTELGRALTLRDVEASIGAPVTASIDIHPEVARAADAGLLARRPPRRALSSLRPLIEPSEEAA